MRLERILRAVRNEPWLILPSSHANICQILDWKLKMTAAEFDAKKREGEDVSGGTIELASMVIEDGIARIPFGGVLIKGATKFEKGSGALAHEDIEADINEAIESPEVRAILLEVDSPGGTVPGSFELADLIAAAAEVKPLMAWVERLCCSAAFLACSGAGMIYGSKTSEIGAVETYCYWIDATAAFDAAGLKVVCIKNTGGTHVAVGMPGQKFTKEQEEEMQSQVDQIFQMYVTHLEEHRPQIKRSAMAGQTFIGTKGIESGMFDAITTKQQALKDLRTWARI